MSESWNQIKFALGILLCVIGLIMMMTMCVEGSTSTQRLKPSNADTAQTGQCYQLTSVPCPKEDR